MCKKYIVLNRRTKTTNIFVQVFKLLWGSLALFLCTTKEKCSSAEKTMCLIKFVDIKDYIV